MVWCDVAGLGHLHGGLSRSDLTNSHCAVTILEQIFAASATSALYSCLAMCSSARAPLAHYEALATVEKQERHLFRGAYLQASVAAKKLLTR